MVRTAPVPNIPPLPGMNPGVWILAGGGGGGGGRGKGKGGRGGKGRAGKGGGKGRGAGGGKNAGGCGPGSGGGCPNPSHGAKGGTSAGDPVDPVSGRVYTVAVTDLWLPGPLGLAIERSYSTALRREDSGLGFGWTHSLDWRVEERRRTVRVCAGHQAPTDCALPAAGETVQLPCGRLTRYAWGYVLETEGLVRFFGLQNQRRYLLTSIVDRNGNKISLKYDQAVLVAATDSAGREIRVVRHSDRHIAAFQVWNSDEGGHWVSFRSYSYDSSGQLVSATAADGHSEHFEYDSSHRLTRRTEPGGLVAEFRYDQEGRCVETYCTRPGNDALDAGIPDTLADLATPAKGFLHVRLDYFDGMTDILTSRSSRQIEGNELDKADRSVWAGGVHRHEFDDAGNVTAYADALDQVWTYERDDSGRLLRATDPCGGHAEYTYNPEGLVDQAVGNFGCSRYTRDDRGNLLSVDDDAGNVATFRYDHRGLMTEATTPNGGVTRFTYDDLGNRIQVIEPDGSKRDIECDFLGRVRSFTDERGFRTSYTYDVCGRLLSVLATDGGITQYGYDPDGHLSSVTDPSGRVTQLSWGGMHVVTAIRRPDGQMVRYFYDREQELVRIVNEVGEEHRLIRTSEGRIAEERTFDGRNLAYSYDLLGNLARVACNGQATDYKYDALGRVVERAYADGRSDTFEYDPLGRMVRASNGQTQHDYAYDSRGNLLMETTDGPAGRFTTSFDYDAVGDVKRVQGPAGVVAVERDVMGRPLSVDYGSALGPERYRYAPDGRADRLLPGGARVETETTPEGRLLRSSVIRPGQVDDLGEPEWVGSYRGPISHQMTYDWNASGELMGAVELGGATLQLERDANGRAIRRWSNSTVVEDYAFGPTGDLLEASVQRQYDRGGRLKRRGSTEYLYDGLGRLIVKRTPGAAGAQVYSYVWGDDGLLQSVDTPDGSSVHFSYDCFARRLEKRVFREGLLHTRTRYFWSGESLVKESREVLVGSAPGVHERVYACLPDSPLPLAQGLLNGEVCDYQHLTYQTNGFPDALLDASGQVLARVESTLFGAVDSAQAQSTELRFPGQIHDPETGLSYNGYRYYDSETGLYISPEPVGILGSLKPYAYVDNYPLERVDFDALYAHAVVRDRQGRVLGESTSAGGDNHLQAGEDLHPAVTAAMAPPGLNAREGGGARGPLPPSNCAEPVALSRAIRTYEQQSGHSCDPSRPGGANNLRRFLNNLDPKGGISSTWAGEPQGRWQVGDKMAPCPNCSQTIPNLYRVAGVRPAKIPRGVVAPGEPYATAGSNPRHSAPQNADYQAQAAAVGHPVFTHTPSGGYRRTQ